MIRRFGEFLKTTAVGGLFVILPVLLLWLLVSEIFQMIVALATPLADLFPKGTFDDVQLPELIAVLLLLGASFLVGLAMRSAVSRRIGRFIDRNTLGRLPMYTAIKSLTKGFQSGEDDTAVRSAVLTSSEGIREVVYVVEDHGDGQLTVLVPWTPAAFAGATKIVNRDQVEMLSADLGEVSRALGNWGVGVRELLEKPDKGDKK